MSPERRKRLPKRPKMSVQKKHEKKGRFGSSRTAFGTAGWQNLKPPWVHRGPKSAGKAVQAGRVLHSKSRQNLKIRQKSGLGLTRLPGGGGYILRTPTAIHRRPLDFIDPRRSSLVVEECVALVRGVSAGSVTAPQASCTCGPLVWQPRKSGACAPLLCKPIVNIIAQNNLRSMDTDC